MKVGTKAATYTEIVYLNTFLPEKDDGETHTYSHKHTEKHTYFHILRDR